MKIYNILPNFLQESLITLYNIKSYGYRYAGKYEEFRNTFKKNRYLKLDELKKIQSERYSQVINKAITQSEFYKKLYENIDNPSDINNIRNLPIVSKETIRNNIDSIVIKTNEKLITSKTGGTTGQSLIVKKRKQDIQERFAMLDDFRSRFGYELGKKTAWFSGKSLLTPIDIKKKRFWKTDHKHNVRYYSTFHIKEDYLKHYVNDLIKYSPEFLVGFPSSILDIAKYGIANGYVFPPNTVKAVFPTAETVTIDMRAAIESFFKTKIYDQYASSEGAPFITECESGCLHMELQSGVFEVLNDKDDPVEPVGWLSLHLLQRLHLLSDMI
jgi:Coenzyme F390 synthetase